MLPPSMRPRSIFHPPARDPARVRPGAATRPRIGRALFGACVASLALACGAGNREATPDARPLVVVSVAPQRALVEWIAGDLVRVETMIPAGANPVTYEPTLAQLRSLSDAALYVKVGHPHFPFEEAWLGRLLAETPDLPVVGGGVEGDSDDPHVWLAPRRMLPIALQVEAALAKLLPSEREKLAQGRRAFDAEVERLDAEVRSILAPLRVRRFYVFHPAWGYFAKAYDLEQVAIEHEHKAPGARALAQLIERARADHVEVVFVQPQFDPSAARVIAEAVGARIEILDPLAPDWSANLIRAARAIAASRSGEPGRSGVEAR